MIIYLSLLVCVVGALVFALSANPKMVELGRLSFWCGLLAFLLRVVGAPVGIIR
jgi:Na+/phosphate symporter